MTRLTAGVAGTRPSCLAGSSAFRGFRTNTLSSRWVLFPFTVFVSNAITSSTTTLLYHVTSCTGVEGYYSFHIAGYFTHFKVSYNCFKLQQVPLVKVVIKLASLPAGSVLIVVILRSSIVAVPALIGRAGDLAGPCGRVAKLRVGLANLGDL